MNIGLTVTRLMVGLAATLVIQEAALAQGHGIEPPIYASFVTMVCHESGGSGAPLTDYVNNRGCLPKRAKSSGFLWITHFAPAVIFRGSPDGRRRSR